MTELEVLDVYRTCGAYREGHFRLSSGLHSDKYFQSALVLAHPDLAARLAGELARKLPEGPVDIVVGPAMGAILVAHEMARALGRVALFAERVDDRFVLRRGFSIPPGSHVLLVEDVLTTGRSILQLAELVEQIGARVAGLACLIDRTGGAGAMKWPLSSLARVAVTIWPPDECPLCAKRVPMDVPGSRKIQEGQEPDSRPR